MGNFSRVEDERSTWSYVFLSRRRVASAHRFLEPNFHFEPRHYRTCVRDCFNMFAQGAMVRLYVVAARFPRGGGRRLGGYFDLRLCRMRASSKRPRKGDHVRPRDLAIFLSRSVQHDDPAIPLFRVDNRA